MITKEEIEKLANLSRLAILEDEKESIRKDIDDIVSYVNEIKKAKVDENVISWEPPVFNNLRKDKVKNERGEYTKSVLENAPKKERDYIKVKKIL